MRLARPSKHPEAVWASDPYGRNRWHVTKKCIRCNMSFTVREDISESRQYCSIECAQLNRQVRVVIVCALCGKEAERKQSSLDNSAHKVYFCSRACKDTGQSLEHGIDAIHPSHYGSGESYRMQAFIHHGRYCHECGYTGQSRMLDVHHIDGDRSNNSLNNLRVLCVWCHACITRAKWENT